MAISFVVLSSTDETHPQPISLLEKKKKISNHQKTGKFRDFT